MARDRAMARPYAKAVFELAEQQQALEEWSQRLAIAAAMVSDPQLRPLMKDPNVSLQERITVLLEIGGDAFSQDMQVFIKILGKFKRLKFLPTIAIMYEEMKMRAEQRIVVRVTSAFPMEPAEQREFTEKIKQRLHQEILLECDTDKSIIGGAIVRAGDLVIDGSIRGKLDKLADSMGILN